MSTIILIIILFILLLVTYLWISQPGNPGFWTPTQIASITIPEFIASELACANSGAMSQNNASRSTNCIIDYMANRYSYNTIADCVNSKTCSQNILNKMNECYQQNGCSI